MKKLSLLFSVLMVGTLLVTACGGSDSEEVNAENDNYTVGIVQLVPIVFDDYVAGFKEKLAQDGFVEGDNVTYVSASSAEELDQMTDVKELDLITIVPSGSASQLGILLDLTEARVPVVVGMGQLDGLLESGFVDNPTQPGKQVTGVNVVESDERRFEIFVDMLPEDTDQIVVTYEANQPNIETLLEGITSTATDYDVEVVTVETSAANLQELPNVIADLDKTVDAVFMLKMRVGTTMWFDMAKERRIPLSFDGDPANTPDWFGVMSYGPVMHSVGQQAGNQAEQILLGTKPGDLPIEDTDSFLTIDLGVADAIGLEVADEILNRASVIHRTEVVLETEDEPAEDLVVDEGAGACMTSITSPGGTNASCVTTTCDSLEDSGFITYTDRVDVAACPTESLVGVCAAEAFDTHYYDGAASMLETGCGFMSGTWTTGDE